MFKRWNARLMTPEGDPGDGLAGATPAVDELTGEAAELAVIDAAIAEESAQVAAPAVEPAAPAVAEEPAAPATEAIAPAAPATEVVADPIEDEIKALEITSDRSKQRFRDLVNETHRLAPLEQPAKNWNELESFLGDARATPEQFGAAVGYLKLINSDDPALLSQAYEALNAELQALGKKLGRDAPGYDPLADHADLTEAVSDGRIERTQAAELARLRREQALHNERTSQGLQERRRAQETSDAVSAGRDDLNALEADLRRLDPAYEAKRDALLPILKPLLAEIHPSQWASKFKEAYLAVGPGVVQRAPAAAPARPPAPLSHQPLRPAGAGGAGLAREPKTEMEAIEFAIQAANAAQR